MTIIRSDADVEAGLAQLLIIDPRLVPVAEIAGPLPLRLAEPGFRGLASIIVSQMVSRASADAIWRRIEASGPVTAERYAALDPQVIATFGLSRAKASTLKGLADTVNSGGIELEGICLLDADEAMRRLVALPGIGPWTAEVYLMFCGGHPDIFPAGDVALRAAVGRGLLLEARPDIRQVAGIAAAWAPYRSVAARLFWAHYAATMRREALPVA
ncbi:DNA-3-methyladenine glycosylase [Neorhizobium sp. NCHU2750]|uniref:DNA-3-methyladenine glycosylase family protein n=1 Tax=Neorhizobium sp. NCHU2750 TaxID=1825976 RepID=UPI000E70D431